MADWNPSLYLQYETERSRPAAELLNRVALESVRSVVDLGCGPGNSTTLLHQRWPSAVITGVDSSPAMLNEARNALPQCHFIEADISQFQPEHPVDLLYANASLQWVPDHYELLPNLVSLLGRNGVLAVQMPDNWLEPTHVLMREVAYEQGFPDRGRAPLPGVHAYYDILTETGCEVDIWRTTYYHIMDSHRLGKFYRPAPLVTRFERKRATSVSGALPRTTSGAISTAGKWQNFTGISTVVYCCQTQ